MEANSKQSEKSEQARRREERIHRITKAMRRDVEIFDRIVEGQNPDAKEQGKR